MKLASAVFPWRRAALFTVLLITCSLTGCGLVANIIHAGWGNLVPARFDQLAGRKVAIVCMSNATSYGNSSAADEITKRVGKKLKDRVPEITLVDQQTIERWMDENDWNEIDYRELGEGVKTDFLIAVDLNSMSLHEGPTLFRGRANVGMTVHDIPGNQVVYQIEPSDIVYPQNSGQHTADASEAVFRRRFIEVVSSHVARHFYSYDTKDDFAQDSTVVN